MIHVNVFRDVSFHELIMQSELVASIIKARTKTMVLQASRLEARLGVAVQTTINKLLAK